MTDYLQTVQDVYAEAARNPDATLCCTESPVWRLPGLHIPPIMQQMNYGCGSTVDPRDLRETDTVLYVGVGGGLEALQFAYFTRRLGGVVAVDPVADMRDKARANFEEAAKINDWFRPDFVTLVDGSALSLPVPRNSATLVAQNCLFNVFTADDLTKALAEVLRVLQPGGRFFTSDPVTPVPLPVAFAADAVQRARCLSGCMSLEDYLAHLTLAGFGRVEVRARIPYRYLHPREFPQLAEGVMLESIEAVAYKVPDGPDGPEVFTGRTATYIGERETLSIWNGTSFHKGMPTAVSDAVAMRLNEQDDFILTGAHSLHAGLTKCC